MRYFMVLILVLWACMGWAEEWSLTDATRIEGPVQFRVESENVPIPMIPDAELALGQYDRSGALIVTKESLDALLQDYPESRLRIVTVPSTCEQRMQAAMTAMEPFLPDGESNIVLTDQYGNYALHPNSHWVGIPEHEVPALRDALAEWKSVRRDCWQ